MTKPDGVATEAENDDVSPSWGTWEELILAFAVNRHGTASWDSISSELQKRTSDPNLSLTARNCRLKYLDLKRRYVADDPDGGESSVDDSAAPLLEELRKLRVAELRREVQRYDLNIESLELKVKSMEEEREKKSTTEKGDSDLEIKGAGEKRGDEPEASGGDRVLGEESEKDQLSVNESNSTDPEAEKMGTGEKETEPGGTGADEASPDRPGKASGEPAELKPEPDRKSAREDSCNGSSNSIEKNEPEAVSCGGEEAAAKDNNSDVQSTASRSRKEEEEEGSGKVRRGNTSSDEIDQSRAVKEFSAQSQPLFDFLQAIRAHKLGSTFERRLRSQQTSVYQKLILQHIDLETVETRLRQGWYSGSGPSPRTKFFRDLLLLANNALVFFPRKSAESQAANEIRTLVSKEITHKKSRSDSSSVKQASIQSLTMSKKPEETDELSNPLMLKPRIPGSLIVCRKRSSIAAKASSSDKKKETQQKTPLLATEEKEPKKSSSVSEEPKITKKRTRDSRVPSSTSPATPANTITKKNNVKSNNQASNNNQKQQGGKGGGGSSSENPKGDSNKKSQSDSKKRGAAIFLNRMKQGSSSSNNNGALLDALKSTPLVTNEGGKRGGGSSEQKKNENVKRGEKDQVTRKSTAETTRQTKEKEKGSPGKRNVGRPPKRGAAAAVVAPPPAAGKRGRERGETETPPGKQQPKKRLRKV